LLFFSCEVLPTVYADPSTCKYNEEKRIGQPEVYYINMDKSKDRKTAMEKHLSMLGLDHHRVRDD